LGGGLRDYWLKAGKEVVATTVRSDQDKNPIIQLDLAQAAHCWPEIPHCHAAVLCAAMTSLEECRSNPAATHFVNVTQTLTLAHRLVEQGSFVVFLSTNLVFDGSRPLRRSTEIPSPITEYGRQKAEAEAGFAQFGERAAIVRLTKVFHSAMPLMRSWIDELRAGRAIAPFADLVCAPISLATATRTIAAIAERLLPGIWQLSAAADISYAHIAERLAQNGGYDPLLVRFSSAPPAMTLESRPRHTTLDATRAESELGFEVPNPLTVVDQTIFP